MSVETQFSTDDAEELQLPEQSKRPWFHLPRRMLVGGLLLVMAFAVLLRSFIFTAGYNTTLVADMGVVRAPISGEIDRLDANVGDRVARDQLLGRFAAPVGLSAAVRAGSEDVDQLQAKLASIDGRMAALRADADHIRSKSGIYRSEKLVQMDAVADESSAELSAAQARLGNMPHFCEHRPMPKAAARTGRNSRKASRTPPDWPHRQRQQRTSTRYWKWAARCIMSAAPAIRPI